MDALTFRPGDAVTHCRRGAGTVDTVSLHPIRRTAVKVIVHFDVGGAVQPVVCWPDDLRPRAASAPVRPRLVIVPASIA